MSAGFYVGLLQSLIVSLIPMTGAFHAPYRRPENDATTHDKPAEDAGTTGGGTPMGEQELSPAADFPATAAADFSATTAADSRPATSEPQPPVDDELVRPPALLRARER